MDLEEFANQLSFWKCPKCGRIHVSFKKEKECFCTQCLEQKLKPWPVFRIKA